MKEWTLMFYFASDNPLAPGIVSQLKALKDAGYHPDVNVIAYFDPQPTGTPTHIFDVNGIHKLNDPEPNIGWVSNDPYIRNLMEDKLWEDDKLDSDGNSIRALLQLEAKKKGFVDKRPTPPLKKPRELSTGTVTGGRPEGDLSLQNFLDFCRTEYQAKHYMLFLLGHGQVVGDDVFLFDEDAPQQSVTLKELGKALNNFKKAIGDSQFELVSFHSCSMSSVEVAYQLRGTANYMLASQGPAFVASWPYRQILIRVFNDVDKLASKKDVEVMIQRIASYVLHNSTDFMVAGYSFDLCLCDLNKIEAVEVPIARLSSVLRKALRDGMVKNCIQLAHLESQSYFSENYTDLYDFCFCLHKYCKQFGEATKNDYPYKELKEACNGVMDVLRKPVVEYVAGSGSGTFNNPICIAEFAGPASQYSHGFSIYFPWTRPNKDRTIMTEYPGYDFQNATDWFGFLGNYWGPQDIEEAVDGSTMRPSSRDENDPRVIAIKASKEKKLREDMLSHMFDSSGPLSTDSVLDGVKPHPRDPTGGDCGCGAIKNYRHDTRAHREKVNQKKPAYVPMTSDTISAA